MRKVGDKVKIRSKEWIDAQPKSGAWGGSIVFEKDIMLPEMFRLAGMEATITDVREAELYGVEYQEYSIDIDGHDNSWLDEMFEPEEVNG